MSTVLLGRRASGARRDISWRSYNAAGELCMLLSPRMLRGGRPPHLPLMNAVMRGFRIETLQWAAAALCGLMGTLLLVAPHRMPAVTGSPLAPAVWWLAVAMALAG